MVTAGGRPGGEVVPEQTEGRGAELPCGALVRPQAYWAAEEREIVPAAVNLFVRCLDSRCSQLQSQVP